jgi:hypothetical protein
MVVLVSRHLEKRVHDRAFVFDDARFEGSVEKGKALTNVANIACMLLLFVFSGRSQAHIVLLVTRIVLELIAAVFEYSCCQTSC